MDQAQLVGVIVAGIAVTQGLVKIVELLVKHLIEQRNKKKLKDLDPEERALMPFKKGFTVDLALQRNSIQELRDDLHDVGDQLEDLPILKERFDAMMKKQDEINGKLDAVHRAIDNNSAATKALHNFLARRSEE